MGLNQETQSTEWTARWVTDLPTNASCRESHLPAGDAVVHEMDVAACGPHQSFTEACGGEMALSDDEDEGSVHSMSNVLGTCREDFSLSQVESTPVPKVATECATRIGIENDEACSGVVPLYVLGVAL